MEKSKSREQTRALKETQAAAHIMRAMVALGMPLDEGRAKTPLRIARVWSDFLVNEIEPKEPAFTMFESRGYSQLITVSNIHFASMCEHHFLPFMGVVHIGYVPSKKLVGLSKIPRAVKFFAKRFHTQEYLTHNLAEYLRKKLEPEFLAVLVEAAHSCVGCRGAEAHGNHTTTCEVFPRTLEWITTKEEFFRAIKEYRTLV